MRPIVLLFALFAVCSQASSQKLLVISVDGLDVRYLKNADRLGLKIPTLRKLAAEGVLSEGVVGIVPTVTWPSHTTLITGVPAEEHGILTNDQPGMPGQRWWFVRFLKAPTLWELAGQKGMKAAAVFWPVTVGAKVDFNIPEFWVTRSAHSIAFAPMAERSTPGLVDRVAAAYPSFPKSLWDDTSAMQSVRYLLEHEQPDLTLAHIADFDAEQHEMGAFSTPAKAILERADELIGWTLQKLPPGTLVSIVSDHGFENVNKVVRPSAMLKEAGMTGAEVAVLNGLIGTKEPMVADFFRSRTGRPGNGLAREVPVVEVQRMAPALGTVWTAFFETAAGHVASPDVEGPPISQGSGKGTHGLWPTRADYRATFLIWGPGVRRGKLPEISMLDIAPTWAEILGVKLERARSASLWPEIKVR